jgi:MFS family permease
VALVPAAADLWMLIAVWVLAAFCVGAVTPSIYGWLGRLGARGGSAFALLAMTNMLGFALGPIVMGQATTFGLEAPFILAAALTFLGWLFVAVSRLHPVEHAAAPAL